MPFKLSNYLLAWTRFSFLDFVIGTVIGSIPYSFTNAYLGWLVAQRTADSTGGGFENLTAASLQAPWWIYGLIATLTAVASVVVAQRALAALRRTPPESAERGA